VNGDDNNAVANGGDPEPANEICQQQVDLASNYDTLKKRCGNDQDRLDTLEQSYSVAQKNCLQAIDKVFRRTDAAVQSLTQEIHDTGDKINAMIKREDDIVSIIKVIADWIDRGTTLLKLGK